MSKEAPNKSLPPLSMVSMTDSLPGGDTAYELEAPETMTSASASSPSSSTGAAAAVLGENKETMFSEDMAMAAGISVEKQLLIRHMKEEGKCSRVSVHQAYFFRTYVM